MHKLIAVYTQNPNLTWDSTVIKTRVNVVGASTLEQAMYYTRVLLDEELNKQYSITTECVHYVSGTVP